jgi:hypothetical protein
MAKGWLWPAAALGVAAAIAGCATGGSAPGCKIVYTIGEPEVAQAIARGRNVTKPGPLPAHVVPASAPRTALEPDGSYAGGRVFCSVADARAAAAELTAKGVLPKDRPWRVYEVGASWEKDVYEKRPGEYRLKHPARMTQLAN